MNESKKIPRIQYTNILYTTDLSEAGRAAFPYAATIANRYGARLTVMHVVESSHFEKYLVGYISEDLWEELKTRDLTEAKEILVQRKRDDSMIIDDIDQFCQQALDESQDYPYVSYKVLVKYGDPVEEITNEANGGDYDLLVIAKHGQRNLTHAVMGNTARRVIRRCNKPVLTVPLPD